MRKLLYIPGHDLECIINLIEYFLGKVGVVKLVRVRSYHHIKIPIGIFI